MPIQTVTRTSQKRRLIGMGLYHRGGASAEFFISPHRQLNHFGGKYYRVNAKPVMIVVEDAGPTGLNIEQNIDDTLSLDDSLSFDRAILIIDTLSLSDTISFQREMTFADALSLADSIAPELGLNLQVDDTLSLSDVVSFAREMTLQDSVSTADSLSFERQIQIADAVALADAITFQFDLHIEDVLAIADLADAVLTPDSGGGATLTVNIDDTVSLSDALSFIREILIADNVIIQDSNARQLNGLFLPDGSVAVQTSRGPIVIGRF